MMAVNIIGRTETCLLQVFNHEGEFLHISLVALLPGLLFLPAGVPAQTLNDVVRHRRAAVVFGTLPAESDGILCHQVDLQLCGGVRWVCGGKIRRGN